MLLSDRRNFLICLAALPLAGCGFEPVYRAGSAASNLTGNVMIDVIDSREGFELLERLESRLGSGGAAALYGLSIDLVFSEEGSAVSTANITTRYTVFGTAKIALRDMASGDVLFHDKLHATTAYSASTSTSATTAAKRSARQRLALALADLINTRLAVTAKDWQL